MCVSTCLLIWCLADPKFLALIIFPHILKGSEAISERPLSGESAMMINGHGTIPIREPTTIFQA